MSDTWIELVKNCYDALKSGKIKAVSWDEIKKNILANCGSRSHALRGNA